MNLEDYDIPPPTPEPLEAFVLALFVVFGAGIAYLAFR